MKRLEQVTSFMEKSHSTIRREPASKSKQTNKQNKTNKTNKQTNKQTNKKTNKQIKNGEAWERGWHVDLVSW